jgi:hypothetical protein
MNVRQAKIIRFTLTEPLELGGGGSVSLHGYYCNGDIHCLTVAEWILGTTTDDLGDG